MLTQGTQIELAANLAIAAVADRELSGSQMQEIVCELTQHMRYENVIYFVLDLQNVEFMASDCLGALVTFLSDVEQIRGRIALANCQPNVAFLFKVTRLDAAFPLYDDIDEAREHIIHG